jgi:O-antigen ligase
VALLILAGFLLRVQWGSINEYDAYIEAGIYFSPFNSFLNLPARVAGPLVSPQALGMFCTSGLTLSVFQKSNSTVRLLVYSVIFFIVGTCTGSRTFYITVFVIIFLKGISFLPKQYKVAFLPSVGIGLLAVYFIISKFFLPLVSSSKNVGVIGGRSYLWETILAHWGDNGLLGHGPNTLETYMHTELGQAPYGHAHNSLLQYLWDFGVLGAVSFIVFIVGCIVTMYSRKPIDLNPLCILLVSLTIQSEPFLAIAMTFNGIYTLLLFLAVFEDSRIRDHRAGSNMKNNVFRNSHEE